MIPIDFLDRLAKIVSPQDLASVEKAMQEPRATSFRVNTLLSSRDEVASLLNKDGIDINRIDWYEDGMWVPSESRSALLVSGVFADQKIYVQNQSSMVPPIVLQPEPADRILDLAAAPGSKTLQMACLTQLRGEIAAVEVVKKRFFKLRDNLKSQGAEAVRTFLKDGRGVWKHRPEYFDRVLLDAPCSSEGRFHVDDPSSYAYWSERKIKEMVRKQKRLLYSAIQCTRPGGTIVYSTCSFAPEENEAIVTSLLNRFEGAIEAAPLAFDLPFFADPLTEWAGKSFHPQLKHARRILPSYHTDGFFVCKLVKHASTL